MAPGPAPCIGLLYQLAIAFPARTTSAGFRQHRSGGGGRYARTKATWAFFRLSSHRTAMILLPRLRFGRRPATTEALSNFECQANSIKVDGTNGTVVCVTTLFQMSYLRLQASLAVQRAAASSGCSCYHVSCERGVQNGRDDSPRDI